MIDYQEDSIRDDPMMKSEDLVEEPGEVSVPRFLHVFALQDVSKSDSIMKKKKELK